MLLRSTLQLGLRWVFGGFLLRFLRWVYPKNLPGFWGMYPGIWTLAKIEINCKHETHTLAHLELSFTSCECIPVT